MACLGVFVIVAGFLYDGKFAGIPYQDPTPAMQARYNFHSNIAGAIELYGAVLFLLSIPVGIVMRIKKGKQGRAK
jgi:hypothetical protein